MTYHVQQFKATPTLKNHTCEQSNMTGKVLKTSRAMNPGKRADNLSNDRVGNSEDKDTLDSRASSHVSYN